MFNALKYLRSAGFTMIELLVVIAVIGVLAVAVLSSINPIEQINKGRDTRSRSDAAQLISAVDRYFAIHEKYPWNEGTSDAPIEGSGGFSAWSYYAGADPWSDGSSYDADDYRSSFLFNEQSTDVTVDEDWAWLLPLVNTAEVKDSFINRIAKVNDNTHFYVRKTDGGNRTMYVCFEPSSYAFDLEATTRCTKDSDTYDKQIVDETDACGAHDPGGSTALCTDSIGDENKCWVCLP